MVLRKFVYDFNDLEEQELSRAPSLDMPHLTVEKFYLPRNNGPYCLFVTKLDKSYQCTCPTCKGSDYKWDGVSDLRLVHDVIRNNRRVDIVLKSPRLYCKNCDRRFIPEIEGILYDRQMTTRLEDFIRKECFLRPFTDVAEMTGFAVSTIAAIMDEEIEKYDALWAANPPEAPRVLGIDEKSLLSDYRATLVDIEKGSLLEILPDRRGVTIQNAIMRMPNWDKNIEVVTVDMAGEYLSWLTAFLPNATVVVDKFHVIDDVGKAVKTSRIKIVEVLENQISKIADPGTRARKESVLRIAKTTRRLFNFSIARLVREGNTKTLAKLTTVITEFPEFKMLHDLHYGIELLYEQLTRADAEKVWDDWMFIVPPGGKKQYKDWCDTYNFDPECFEAFRSFSRAQFKIKVPYIMNYFNSPSTRYTNAATEGLNSLIENVNIAGKGYSFPHLRAKCLYAPLVHEKLNYGINMKSVKDALKYVSDARDLFTPVCIPPLNVYHDNNWIFAVMSEKYSEFIEQYKLDWDNDNPEFDCSCDEQSILDALS